MRFELLPRPLRAILLLTLLTANTTTFAQIQPSSSAKASSIESFKACQTRSPNTGSFFDLNPIRILPPLPETTTEPQPSKGPKPQANAKAIYPDAGRRKWSLQMRKPEAAHAHTGKRKGRKVVSKAKSRTKGISILQEKDEKEKEAPKSWHARGHAYPANFTMNFCGPVVEEEQKDEAPLVEGFHHMKWENVGAYYIMDNHTFSIGQQNSNLSWSGRKLTLNFTNGSPCPKNGTERHDQFNPDNWSKRRKSTLISLLCEREPSAPRVSISFVGTMDECTYFFEAKSSAACPAVQIEKQQVGPSGVFAVISVIALLVYVIGGIVYQRAVMHQRGWRQLPNYSLWHGIFTFLQDILIITVSSCGRCLGLGSGSGSGSVFGGRKSRGYNQVPTNAVNGNGNGVNAGRREDENRLLDELDEEWDH